MVSLAVVCFDAINILAKQCESDQLGLTANGKHTELKILAKLVTFI